MSRYFQSTGHYGFDDLLIELCFSQLLEEIVDISETFVEGEGQRARALYKLAVIHAERGVDQTSAAYKVKALQARASAKPELEDAAFKEEEFSKLCLWMLW